MDERLSINVTIDGHQYPMKIKRTEEEVIRRAVQLINDKLVMYKQKFSSKDKSPFDFLAMVCLDFATKYLNSENTSDDSDFVSELQILSGEIDDYIQKSNVL
ncbi:MAG: cell division protein ZapA [Bacteroidales bacterium]|jgi:cell division protein ZapA|nr:cell division protein ZapA [Bacteroidales bacterium]MBQ1883673.1 cell division protein ZapA [Bacteroidales bacterium]MBQ3617160.1 cell division protein ZapA [Bacteroidales bacterium]MDD6004030.1 cell division protein ZapA [Bacteroidales bacterium]